MKSPGAVTPRNAPQRWLNRTVLGIGLASLLSDWSHEIATTVMPAFLATMGVAAAWLGLIEGVSDGLSSFAKMASGYYTDKLQRRKPIAVVGYLVTALGTASFGLASAAWHVLIARASAWLGRGVRTPVRKALLAAAVTKDTYGRAFGCERIMDTMGAIVGPASALILLQALNYHYPPLFALTLIPSLIAAGLIVFAVKEKERAPVPHVSFGRRLRLLPAAYRKLLVAVGLFGMGAFALIFILGGTNVALEETLEDSLCAELVAEEHHGIAFGAMATVNGIGDFFSSIVVGALWTGFGTTSAFGYSAALSIAGALLVSMLRPS